MENVKFWQTRIKITQVPVTQENDYVNDPQTNRELEFEKSWLCDPFLDQTIYGAEFTIKSDFSWVFFFPADSRSEAVKKGHGFLSYLKGKFPGLDGEVFVIPIMPHILKQKRLIYEIILPRPRFGYYNRINIFKKFINLFYFHNLRNLIKLYIFWQKDDSINSMNEFPYKRDKESILSSYKIKIFVATSISEDVKNLEYLKFIGQLEYLASEIQNGKGESAKVAKPPLNTWKNMLEGQVFWQNKDKIYTGKYYEKIIEDIPETLIPGFLSPYVTDFTIPSALPLPKAFILENENVNHLPITKENKNYIWFGKISHHGVSTDRNAYIAINDFSQSVLIAGMPGSGKTRLLSQIMQEFYNKAPNVGILVLNVGKGNQGVFYKSYKVIKYGDPDFRVPYFGEGEYIEKSIQETAVYLISALGLKNVVENNMINVMKSFIYTDEELPKSLSVLFNNLLKYFDEKRYHEKFHTNITRAIENRVISLLSDPIISKTLELFTDPKLPPKWLSEWMNGKKIILDMSMCNKYTKRLLTSAIFQLIRVFTPDTEAFKLQNIIVIDEAHQITEKSMSLNPDDDDFIATSQLEKVFTGLLREFRSKGLSFILSDQTPSRLFNCVATLPSIKILFRLGFPCNTLFTSNPRETDFLNLQKNRQALVYNGIMGEKYVIETLDYLIPSEIKNIKKKNKSEVIV